MIDLSSKLSSFRKLVWDVEKKKSEKELYDSTNSSSELIENKKIQLKNNMNSYLEKRKEFARIRKNEMIAKKTEEEKNIYNKYKESLLNKTLDDIRSSLIEYTKTEEYKNRLIIDVEEKIKMVKNEFDGEIILCLGKEDKDLFDYQVKILDSSYIGGFIIRDKDESFEYDFSLKRKLNDKKYEIGKRLYSELDREEVSYESNY